MKPDGILVSQQGGIGGITGGTIVLECTYVTIIAIIFLLTGAILFTLLFSFHSLEEKRRLQMLDKMLNVSL